MSHPEDGAAPAANHQGGARKTGQDFKRGSILLRQHTGSSDTRPQQRGGMS